MPTSWGGIILKEGAKKPLITGTTGHSEYASYLCSVVPIYFVAVVALGIVRCSDLDPTQATKHLNCIRLKKQKHNNYYALSVPALIDAYRIRCGGVSREKVNFEISVQKDAGS